MAKELRNLTTYDNQTTYTPTSNFTKSPKGALVRVSTGRIHLTQEVEYSNVAIMRLAIVIRSYDRKARGPPYFTTSPSQLAFTYATWVARR